VTGSKVAGPNVLHASSSTKVHADIGPDVVVPLLIALFVVVVFAVAFAVAFWVHRRRRCKTASAGRRKEVNEDVDTGEEYYFKEGRTTWTRPGRSLVGERVLGKLNW
jgi:hypothetical protein